MPRRNIDNNKNIPCCPPQALFKARPYPAQRVYIRRGHGFFLLARSVEDCRHAFRNLIMPHLAKMGGSCPAAPAAAGAAEGGAACLK